MKPFYRYNGLSDECPCGSRHTYKDCCFHSDLWGFMGALVLIAITVLLPVGSWVLRALWAIIGVLMWLSLLQRVREWFVKRRARTAQQR